MTNAFMVLQMNTLLRKEGMCFTLVTNVLVLETNALEVCFQTSHAATSNFQAELFSKMLLTGTHL